MKFDRFEDIYAWQKAKILTVRIYQLLEHSKDYGFMTRYKGQQFQL